MSFLKQYKDQMLRWQEVGKVIAGNVSSQKRGHLKNMDVDKINGSVKSCCFV